MGFLASIFGGSPKAPPPPAPLPPVPTGPDPVTVQQNIAQQEARRRARAGSVRDDVIKTSALGLSPTAGETTTGVGSSLLGV